MTTPDDPSGNEGWRAPGESGPPDPPPPPPEPGQDPWRGLGNDRWNESQGQPQYPPPGSPPPQGGPPPQQWGGAPPGQWQSPGYGAPHVPNYLVLGILTTLFCCQPFGIASIVFAARANGKAAAGDYAGALEDARKGRLWGIVAVSVGVVVILGYFAFIAAVGFSSFNDPTAFQ